MNSGLIPENTIVVFLSDHGEMLGNHQWTRKRNALESSIRVPFIIRLPNSMRKGHAESQSLVEIMDLMPTLLDLVDVPVPETVSGASLKRELLGGESLDRSFVHGECSHIPTENSGMQFIRDARRKYIWYPGTDKELFFDLEDDPDELVNLIDDPESAPQVDAFRNLLIQELNDRPEGFVEEGALRILGGPSPKNIPCRWDG